MWDVNVTLPDSAPRMFEVAFGHATVDETLLVTQGAFRGELEGLSECSDAAGDEIKEITIG